MLIIRNAQLQSLSQRPREQFIEDMLSHLYRYFPVVAWLLTPDELRCQVDATIACAAAYQLTSHQQVCRFINLTATYGWQFDKDPDLLWMRNILTDSSLSYPSERLDRLVQTCLHRKYIEEHNRIMRRQLGLMSEIAPCDYAQEQAEDYLGKHYANTQPTNVTTKEIIVRNPLSYHRSQSLWADLEALSVVCPGQTELIWLNNINLLLRKKTGEQGALRN